MGPSTEETRLSMGASATVVNRCGWLRAVAQTARGHGATVGSSGRGAVVTLSATADVMAELLVTSSGVGLAVQLRRTCSAAAGNGRCFSDRTASQRDQGVDRT